jgi:hypothetical protein
MNFMQSKIRSRLTNRYAIGVYVAVAITLSIWTYTYVSTKNFVASYVPYATEALEQEAAAYVPAASNNQYRQELNKTLAEVLTKKLSERDRVRTARRGLELLAEVQRELDRIQDRGGSIDQAIVSMEQRVNPLTDFSSGGDMRRIVALAKQRGDIISDIRALTSRANFETARIFNHIIQDEGVLSDEYVLTLNADIPAIEERFNKRSGLYNELEVVSDDILQTYLDLHVFGIAVGGK